MSCELFAKARLPTRIQLHRRVCPVIMRRDVVVGFVASCAECVELVGRQQREGSQQRFQRWAAASCTCSWGAWVAVWQVAEPEFGAAAAALQPVAWLKALCAFAAALSWP